MSDVTAAKASSLERFTVNWAAQNDMSVQRAMVELFAIIGATLAKYDTVAFTETVEEIRKGLK